MPSQQIDEHFIGRQKELEVFRQWFTGSEVPWIVHFYDALKEKEKKGGVGKTWLLRECALLAKQLRPETAVVMIDFFNIASRDGIAVAERIVEALEDTYPQWSARTFAETLAEYRGTGNPEYRESTEGRIELSRALISDLSVLDQQLADKQRSLLVFFDTFELIEQNPTIAILNFSGTFPDNYQFNHMGVIIASRNELDWSHHNWRGCEKEVLSIPIAPFSRPEMIEYLQAESIYSLHTQPEQTLALYERTEGRPILVGLVADVLNHRVMTVNELIAVPQPDFELCLVSPINQLQNPLNWVIIFMAHVYHRFNATILERILRESILKDVVQEDSLQYLVEILPTLSFVRGSVSSSTFVLHDEMRRLVTRYVWVLQDTDQTYRKEISRCVIGYYEEQIAHTQSEQERQAYVIEKLYHQFFVNLDEGLYAFQQHFQRAIRLWSSPFGHLLLLEAQKFESSMSPLQQNELKSAHTKLQAVEEDAAAARHIMYEGLARSKGTEFQQNKTDLPKSSEILKIFYSYADKDKELVEQLQMHLAVLKQRNLITDWHKGKLAPGEDIANQMRHLNTAHIILLCISPDFVASDYSNTEIMHALERYRAKKATVIPILLRPTGNWKDASFGNLQALPRNSKAVTRWASPDEAFDEIAWEIKEVIDQLRNKTF